MIATITQNAPVITESKIIHKSAIVHPLARFVTEQTVALMFNIQIEQIYQIQCWRYVVYVHGHGISKFVSYADFPAILEVEPPKAEDFVRWRKRWYKCHSQSTGAGVFGLNSMVFSLITPHPINNCVNGVNWWV
jgi:hypothetical protein